MRLSGCGRWRYSDSGLEKKKTVYEGSRVEILYFGVSCRLLLHIIHSWRMNSKNGAKKAVATQGVKYLCDRPLCILYDTSTVLT